MSKYLHRLSRLGCSRNRTIFTSPLRFSSTISTQQLTPLLISIEGNIGAGKSTILGKLKERNPDLIFVDEPVKTWSTLVNDQKESILELFYRDRKRWSYTFQNCALLTRFQIIEEAIETAKSNRLVGPHIFITERCLETDYHVFTKMLFADGSLDSLELALYEKLLQQLKHSATPLKGIIHIDTSPPVCLSRISQRARKGEDSISLSYLENLDRHQDLWLQSCSLPQLKLSQTQKNKEKNTKDDKVKEDSIEMIEKFIRSFAK